MEEQKVQGANKKCLRKIKQGQKNGNIPHRNFFEGVEEMFQKLNVESLRSPILIISPHPDDDILGSAGLIQRARGLGKQIYVLYLTNGDANRASVTRFLKAPLTPQSFIRLGRIRHIEAIKAEASLGIPQSHLFFVSFPDGGTLQIAQSPTPGKVFRSKSTLLSLASYPFAFVRNAPYSKMVVVQLIRTILNRVRPRTIIMNLANDTNPDHKAARLLTLDAIRGTCLKPFILSYLIHFPHFPKRGEFVPPQQLLSPRIRQLILNVSELRRKKRAFQLEPSQFDVSPRDRSLLRGSEFFWVGSTKVAKKNFSTSRKI
ncbi:PIG-L deacetylase family protein [Paenibacillus sp. Soil787]|uniref:PIG-L deacetylase family protein n=1 Tax=Paenibacillus sp. Soil787 TaxID=1736411 RepID=UPI0007025C3D|nr:PIG-L family deacetylase [Paenibacillus sp. Soil787]KRF19223.1 hypothetical protein ASG93_32735 [Paenibacillus sp. Soil787]